MKKTTQPHMEQLIVIVHGKSEWHLSKNIHSNLRIGAKVIARDNGRSSIQISGLCKFLQTDGRMSSISKFIKENNVYRDKTTKRLSLKIFAIMDMDDCKDEAERNAYMDGSLFNGLWQAPYIVPIYNRENLESTMLDCGVKVEKKKDYCKIFPTNHGDIDLDAVKEFRDKVKKSKKTNLEIYLDYCIERCEKALV